MNKWWKSAIVYQIYPFSFKDSNGDGKGDLKGIIQKLPYLSKLGINVIWLNPIFESPFIDNGYDISDYYKINPILGTMNDFTMLLNKAHSLGIKIILDLVVNHTSNEHKWFKESCKKEKNKYTNFYIWKKGKSDGSPPNNWGSTFGGSAWEYVPSRDMYYLHLFAKEQPDLNWENPVLRNSIYSMMKYWLDIGIDGFRMDVISLISKKQDFPDAPVDYPYNRSYYFGSSNGPRVHEFIREMNEKVLSKYNIMTVGETPNTTSEQALLYVGENRKELNMVFQFDHMHLDYGINGKYSTTHYKLNELKQVFTEWEECMNKDGWNSLYWSNHDQPRAVTRFGNDSTYRFESAKMLGTLLHMMKGTPFIYQGEEIGMKNPDYKSIKEYKDVEAISSYKSLKLSGMKETKALNILHLKARDNARSPMQWDKSINSGFSTSKPWLKLCDDYKDVNVKNEFNEEKSVLNHYIKLIKLRKKYPVVVFGDYEIINKDDSSVYAYIRKYKNEELIVICSLVSNNVLFRPDVGKLSTKPKLLLSNYSDSEKFLSSKVELKPYEAMIYYINN
ncbi:MAG: alpha-glucosidase [Lactobacillus sp.]|nr:alpha-glucosidase [Lactobacillus sp.]